MISSEKNNVLSFSVAFGYDIFVSNSRRHVYSTLIHLLFCVNSASSFSSRLFLKPELCTREVSGYVYRALSYCLLCMIQDKVSKLGMSIAHERSLKGRLDTGQLGIRGHKRRHGLYSLQGRTHVPDQSLIIRDNLRGDCSILELHAKHVIDRERETPARSKLNVLLLDSRRV